MLQAVDGGDASADAYQIVSQLSTFKVNPNNTTTSIEQITARSIKYGVSFTFNVTRATYLADGAPGLTGEKTAQVNEIAGQEHVQAVRGEQDQGSDGNLYNYLVVTVGDPSLARTEDVRIRMDNIGTVGAFAAITAAWQRIGQLGATAPDDGS